MPAGLNNIVGLKPSLGLVSTAGVVPACRTLDCVSIFALTVDDALAALTRHCRPGCRRSLFARPRPLGAPGRCRAGLRLGVPLPASACSSATAHRQPLTTRRSRDCARLGATIVEIDIEPFYETARLLYEGPWVAERYIAVALADRVRRRNRCIPVTRADHLGGRAAERGRCLRARSTSSRSCGACATTPFGRIDALVLPTAPTVYTVEQVLADPIAAQQPARHLHQFRQPARPLRPRRAGGDARGRHAVRRHAARAGRHDDARWRRIGRAFHADDRTAARRARHGRSRRSRRSPTGPRAGEIAARGGRRASFRHAAQRRAARRSARASSSGRTTAPRLSALCACRHHAAEARACCASAPAQGAAIDVEVWALPAEGVRPLRRRRPAAAVDRHARPRRRPRGQGLSGRGRGDRAARATSPLRRLARFMAQMKVSA